jgi:hypothetical protein
MYPINTDLNFTCSAQTEVAQSHLVEGADSAELK